MQDPLAGDDDTPAVPRAMAQFALPDALSVEYGLDLLDRHGGLGLQQLVGNVAERFGTGVAIEGLAASTPTG